MVAGFGLALLPLRLRLPARLASIWFLQEPSTKDASAPGVPPLREAPWTDVALISNTTTSRSPQPPCFGPFFVSLSFVFFSRSLSLFHVSPTSLPSTCLANEHSPLRALYLLPIFILPENAHTHHLPPLPVSLLSPFRGIKCHSGRHPTQHSTTRTWPYR